MRLNNLSFFDFLWNAWTWIATCVWFFFFGCECHDYLICFEATIRVTNLETLVWFSPSPMLIWVLQSSQCSKICMAQHWGRRGAHLWENEGVRSENKWLLFQRFVTSIVFSWKRRNNCRFKSRWIFWDHWWKICVFFFFSCT